MIIYDDDDDIFQPSDCHEHYFQTMVSCWQDNPDNRPTFETLYMRFDEFMIQAEPSYREVRMFLFD
jgi:hypothetical protein